MIALLLRDMFAEPSKETPAIVLAVASFVAVAELPVHEADDPVVFWLSVATLAAAIVPEDMLLAFKLVRDAPDPLNKAAVIVPSAVIPNEPLPAFVTFNVLSELVFVAS